MRPRFVVSSPTTLNVGVRAANQRAIPRYPRAIDFDTSNGQDDCRLTCLALPSLTEEPIDVERE
jgi:hypothetical protein